MHANVEIRWLSSHIRSGEYPLAFVAILIVCCCSPLSRTPSHTHSLIIYHISYITHHFNRYEIHSLAGSEDVQFLHTVSSTTIREAIRAVYGGTKAKARAEGGDVGEKTSETETSETETETETEKEKEEKGALLIRSLVPEVLEYIREHNLFQA